MGVCKGCSQFFLVIINIIFSLIGITLLVVGSIVRWGNDTLNNLLQDSYSRLVSALKDAGIDNANISQLDIGDFLGDVTVAFVVIGAFFFVIGILGCIGACCKVRCMLVTYVVFLVIVLLAEVTLIILIFAVRSEVEKWFKEPFKKSITEDYTGIAGEDSITLAINFVSTEFKCCGVDNYKDFNNTKKWNNTLVSNQVIPVVCCKEKRVNNQTDWNIDCLTNPTANNSYAYQGCYKAIEDWLQDNNSILIGSGAAILAVEILLMIFSIIVSRKDKKKDGYDEY